MKCRLIMTLIGLVLSGCTIIEHKDQLLTMAELARDKNSQGQIVDSIDASYDSLAAVINSGKIKEYTNQSSILRTFGEPIARKKVDVNGKSQDQWLYRHSIPQKANDKIYLYFNEQGQLIDYKQEKIEW